MSLVVFQFHRLTQNRCTLKRKIGNEGKNDEERSTSKNDIANSTKCYKVFRQLDTRLCVSLSKKTAGLPVQWRTKPQPGKKKIHWELGIKKRKPRQHNTTSTQRLMTN